MTDVLAFTGHRPDKIKDSLVEVRCGLVHYLTLFRPDKAISGMADGFDTESALTCIELDIPLICAIPFFGHKSRVSDEIYDFICSKAEQVVYVSEEPYRGVWQLLKRNIWMVDNSIRLGTCWDGSSGGTEHCVRYAKGRGRKMDRVWGVDPNA